MRHCQAAVRLDLVARNVADNAEPPKSEDREVEILKASDVPAVLDALKVLASCWGKSGTQFGTRLSDTGHNQQGSGGLKHPEFPDKNIQIGTPRDCGIPLSYALRIGLLTHECCGRIRYPRTEW
jgi:hypothetical protein